MSMNLNKLYALSLSLLAVSACSTTPDQNRSSLFNQSTGVAAVANTARTQAVASAGIGIPQVYTDGRSGKSIELVVESEYFSANGRVCRRFSEFVDGRDVAGVSCQDDTLGWIEIPLSSFVR